MCKLRSDCHAVACHTSHVKCLCWSLGHADQLLFSCVSSKVIVCHAVTCHVFLDLITNTTLPCDKTDSRAGSQLIKNPNLMQQSRTIRSEVTAVLSVRSFGRNIRYDAAKYSITQVQYGYDRIVTGYEQSRIFFAKVSPFY